MLKRRHSVTKFSFSLIYRKKLLNFVKTGYQYSKKEKVALENTVYVNIALNESEKEIAAVSPNFKIFWDSRRTWMRRMMGRRRMN